MNGKMRSVHPALLAVLALLVCGAAVVGAATADGNCESDEAFTDLAECDEVCDPGDSPGSPDCQCIEPNTATSVVGNTRTVNWISTADLDGDGDVDILATSQNDDKVVWLSNQGDGSFVAADLTASTTSFNHAWGVEAAYVNGDAHLDLVVTTASFTWLIPSVGVPSPDTPNLGTPVQIAATGGRGLALADVDGAGGVDVATISHSSDFVRWYSNTAGDGSSWSAKVVDGSVDARDIAIGDLDGALGLDLVVGSLDGLFIYKSAATASGFGSKETIATERCLYVALGDLNGDSHVDIVGSRSTENTVSWWPNDGTGSFGARQDIVTGHDVAGSVAVADMDNDGDLDVVSTLSIVGDTDFIMVHTNDGTGTFSTSTMLEIPAPSLFSMRGIVVDDIVGNGQLLDVVSPWVNEGDVRVTSYTSVCDGICSTSVDESGTSDCDGKCNVGEDGSSDCDATCDATDDMPSPDCTCNGNGVCETGEDGSGACSSDCDGFCAVGEEGSADCNTVCENGDEAWSDDCTEQHYFALEGDGVVGPRLMDVDLDASETLNEVLVNELGITTMAVSDGLTYYDAGKLLWWESTPGVLHQIDYVTGTLDWSVTLTVSSSSLAGAACSSVAADVTLGTVYLQCFVGGPVAAAEYDYAALAAAAGGTLDSTLLHLLDDIYGFGGAVVEGNYMYQCGGAGTDMCAYSTTTWTPLVRTSSFFVHLASGVVEGMTESGASEVTYASDTGTLYSQMVLPPHTVTRTIPTGATLLPAMAAGLVPACNFDGVCDPGETVAACASDCNGVCGAAEASTTVPDCNGKCEIGDEAGSADCGGACHNYDEDGSTDCEGTCDAGDVKPSPDCNCDGDGMCETGEDGDGECSSDCNTVCSLTDDDDSVDCEGTCDASDDMPSHDCNCDGDGLCEAGEDALGECGVVDCEGTCEADDDHPSADCNCDGDGVCEAGEDGNGDCSSDCDGTCDATDDRTSPDCPQCDGNDQCEAGETGEGACALDCDGTCDATDAIPSLDCNCDGDGLCEAGEDALGECGVVDCEGTCEADDDHPSVDCNCDGDGVCEAGEDDGGHCMVSDCDGMCQAGELLSGIDCDDTCDETDDHPSVDCACDGNDFCDPGEDDEGDCANDCNGQCEYNELLASIDCDGTCDGSDVPPSVDCPCDGDGDCQEYEWGDGACVSDCDGVCDSGDDDTSSMDCLDKLRMLVEDVDTGSFDGGVLESDIMGSVSECTNYGVRVTGNEVDTFDAANTFATTTVNNQACHDALTTAAAAQSLGALASLATYDVVSVQVGDNDAHSTVAVAGDSTAQAHDYDGTEAVVLETELPGTSTLPAGNIQVEVPPSPTVSTSVDLRVRVYGSADDEEVPANPRRRGFGRPSAATFTETVIKIDALEAGTSTVVERLDTPYLVCMDVGALASPSLLYYSESDNAWRNARSTCVDFPIPDAEGVVTSAAEGLTFEAPYYDHTGTRLCTWLCHLTEYAVFDSSASTTGDPHFEGFHGGWYDFMGEAGKVFNLFTDTTLHVNARFVEFAALPGQTYMGEIGVRAGPHRVYMAADGTVRVPDAPGCVLVDPSEPNKCALHGGGHVRWSDGRVDIEWDVYRLSLTTEVWTFAHTDAEAHGLGYSMAVNHAALARSGRAESWAPHGVHGQVADVQHVVVGSGKQGEGVVAGHFRDYEVASGDLFGVDVMHAQWSESAAAVVSEESEESEWEVEGVSARAQ